MGGAPWARRRELKQRFLPICRWASLFKDGLGFAPVCNTRKLLLKCHVNYVK